jgi:hypothetical protein
MADFHVTAEFLAEVFPAAASTPARSAASIMEALRMRIPLAGMQVSAAEGFMEAEAFMLVEADTDEQDASDTGKSTEGCGAYAGDGHDV